jgi:hypothetical protein
MISTEEKINQAISNWWNDCCRKTWRQDFANPEMRSDLFLDLQKRIIIAISETKGE